MKEILGIRLYSIQEVGELLGIQPQSVSKYIQQGRVKCQTIGGRKYISEENLKEFLQSSDKPSAE